MYTLFDLNNVTSTLASQTKVGSAAFLDH